MKLILLKMLIFIILFPVICFIAGIYGFLHDQISYTVSPEYFTQLKFAQFNIQNNLHNRLGAGIVGIMATWWMGIIIGIIIIPIGLIIPNWKNYLKIMLKSFIYVSLTAFIIGIIALFYGLIFFNVNNLPNFNIPNNVIDKVNFCVIGNMHNFSYIGGLVGILVGIVYIVIKKIKIKKCLFKEINE